MYFTFAKASHLYNAFEACTKRNFTVTMKTRSMFSSFAGKNLIIDKRKMIQGIQDKTIFILGMKRKRKLPCTISRTCPSHKGAQLFHDFFN